MGLLGSVLPLEGGTNLSSLLLLCTTRGSRLGSGISPVPILPPHLPPRIPATHSPLHPHQNLVLAENGQCNLHSYGGTRRLLHPVNVAGEPYGVFATLQASTRDSRQHGEEFRLHSHADPSSLENHSNNSQLGYD